jgi:hypothetical protein
VKTLTIEVNYFKNESHKIHLGNCEWLELKGKRYVRDYIVKYKRMLIDNAGCINNFRMQVSNLYYMNYFELSDRTARQAEKQMSNLNMNFSYIFETYSTGNNNSFVLRRFDNCFNDLLATLDILKDHAHRYKNYNLKNQVKFLTRSIEDRMEAFEKERRTLDINELSKDGKYIKLQAVRSDTA